MKNRSVYALQEILSVNSSYAFLEYIIVSDNDHIVEKSIIQQARLDVSIAIVLTCLYHGESNNGHSQKMYADTFTSHEQVDQLCY